VSIDRGINARQDTTKSHQDATRGFEVRVFESKPIFGGKARSIPVPNSAVEGRKLLPGEHGFRFFPGFWAHGRFERVPQRGGRFQRDAACARLDAWKPRGIDLNDAEASVERHRRRVRSGRPGAHDNEIEVVHTWKIGNNYGRRQAASRCVNE
jgi:hypothetical protein